MDSENPEVLKAAKAAVDSEIELNQRYPWHWHAERQLEVAVKEAKLRKLSYDKDANVILQAPSDCQTMDELADYTLLIQELARLPKYSAYIAILPSPYGALHQRFTLATGYEEQCILAAKIGAQADYCAANKLPRLTPANGICWSCRRQIYHHYSIKGAGNHLIVGCPYCSRTYCD